MASYRFNIYTAILIDSLGRTKIQLLKKKLHQPEIKCHADTHGSEICQASISLIVTFHQIDCMAFSLDCCSRGKKVERAVG